MNAVHFIENRNVLLTQLLQNVPAEGEQVTIKGRKGKVTSVHHIDEKNVMVEVTLQSKVKAKAGTTDNAKTKKGRK